jgi:hypothetical protein
MVGRNKMATISEPTTVVQWQNSWFYSTDSGSIPGGCPRRWKTFCCGHPDAMHQQYGICYSRKELLWILFQIWQHNTHWIKNILRVKKQRVKIIWMFKEHSMNKPCFTQNTWYEWAVWFTIQIACQYWVHVPMIMWHIKIWNYNGKVLIWHISHGIMF